MDTILHARKSLLFSGGKNWVKNNISSLFDVTMGSFDGAEICELVGAYVLATLPKTLQKEDVGLYRDNGLMVHTEVTGGDAERIKKQLTKHFESLGLRITIQTNLKIANFLDLTLDLIGGKYYPFRKPNNDPTYIHTLSNHPPSVLNNIPASISRRITDTSSDKESFDRAAPLYDNALQASGFKEKVTFMAERKNRDHSDKTGKEKKKRKRKIIWFNPPFCKSVKTSIGRKFLGLVTKHFPKGSPLSKIFNRNTVKVSFSCMPNMANVIKAHNTKILAQTSPAATGQDKLCNCRDTANCPLGGRCQVSSIVYKATVATEDGNQAMHYFGLCQGTFKKRYSSHLCSFRHERYRSSTELSKYVWQLKEKGTDFAISWSVCQKATPYSSGSKLCQLCLAEKLCIISAEPKSLLNKKTEIVSTCRHRRKFLLSTYASPAT